MDHRIRFAFITAVICIASATATQAQSPPPAGQGRGGMRVACGTDMQGLCAGLKGKDAARRTESASRPTLG